MREIKMDTGINTSPALLAPSAGFCGERRTSVPKLHISAFRVDENQHTSKYRTRSAQSAGHADLAGDFEVLSEGEDVLAGEVLIDVRWGDRQPLPGTKTPGEPLINNCVKGPFV